MAETGGIDRPTRRSTRFKRARPSTEDSEHKRKRHDYSSETTSDASVDTPPPAPSETGRDWERMTQEERVADLNRKALIAERNQAILNEQMQRGEAREEHYKAAFGDWFVEEDWEVLEALKSPEKFLDYADKTAKIVQKHHKEEHGGEELAGRELWFEVSEEIKTNIALRFSRLYRDAHTENANKYMQEIAQENFMKSIQTAEHTLARMISVLSDELARAGTNTEIGQRVSEMKFFKNSSLELPVMITVDTVDKNPDGSQITRQEHKMKSAPIAGAESISVAEYLNSVRNHAKETIEVESYSHNMNVIFSKGAPDPQKGFWGTVAHYAEDIMKSVTMDSIHHLPDSDAFISAGQLYKKYLEGRFGMQDWMHDPKMFSADLDSKWSALQKRVLNDLKLLYPKLAKGGEEWRLNRAMNIGLGMARGINLMEVTTAAWADPPHKEGGKDGYVKASYASYYTNDNAALNALNGAHEGDRWRHENVFFSTLMQVPVAGLPRKLMKRWNHRRPWQEMEKRERSYYSGDAAYAREPASGMSKMVINHYKRKGYLNADGSVNHENLKKGGWLSRKIFGRLNRGRYFETNDRLVSLQEFLPNIGKVGSALERRGWRNEEGLDGWFVRDENGVIDIERSVKALENIGFEAVKWFAEEQKLEKKGAATHKNGPNKGELKEEYRKVYDYLYKKYILSGSTDPKKHIGIREYFKQISDAGIDNPEGTFMSRVYVNMLRQRMPSKLIVTDRSRYSSDGVRAWKRVFDKLHLVKTHFGENDPESLNPTHEMDRAMSNLMLVEQKLRMNVSERMKKGLSAQPGANKDLSLVEIKDYQVTGDMIKAVLEKMLPEGEGKQGQINNTLQLFQEMNAFLDEDGQNYLLRFADKIRDNGKVFKYFPYAIAAEELDTSFITYRNAGPTLLKRAIGDLAAVETDVVNVILKEWFDLLKETAADGKHDMTALVEKLKPMKKKLLGIHNEEMATEVMHHLAYATIAYFRKDVRATNLFTKWFFLGEKHSIAAELASGNATARNIWEWTPSDVSKYIMLLDRARLLPSNPAQLAKGEVVTKKFLGVIPYKKLIYDEATKDMEYSANKLRRDAGATKFDLMKEYISKYLPILGAATLYLMIKKAMKESEDKK